MLVGARCGVMGLGYEGRSVGEFVADLFNLEVVRLVDVRLTPISRKRGFSKTALGEALVAAGVTYEHRRELGNPKDNRPGFTGSEAELADARARYLSLLDGTRAQRSLDELGELAIVERVALLCFEADQRRCHRDVLLEELARRSESVTRL